MSGTSGLKGGSSSGGIAKFLAGLVMMIAGAWLLANQVIVQSGYWRLWGFNAFGLTLLPLLAGIALLFFDGRSFTGRALTVIGIVIIFLGIITNLDIYFRPTTLFNTLLMLGLLAGGVGLIAKSLGSN